MKNSVALKVVSQTSEDEKNNKARKFDKMLDAVDNELLTAEEIILEHGDFVRKFIMKRTWDEQAVEDTFQSTMLEALKSFHNFRGDSHPRTWLCGIAYNMIRIHAKSLNIPAMDPLEVLDSKTGIVDYCQFGTEDPCDIYERESRLDNLQRVFDSLPTDMRVTFNEVVNLGKSYEETAEKLGLPIGTVRSRIARAREIFRTRLGDDAKIF